MTDHLDPLDELASAHLDGQTTPAEVARIAQDPLLSARVERLAAIRYTLRADDSVGDPARRDQAVAAALAAFDEAVEMAPHSAGASVIPLVAPAARWPRPRPRTLALVGIAAGVAVLALAGPLLDRLDSGSREDLATTLESEADMSLREGSSDQATTADAPSALAMAAALPDLGLFDGFPALADAVRSQVGDGSAASASSSAAAPDSSGGTGGKDTAGGTAQGAAPAACAEETAAGDPVLYTALAELDGQLVVVVVREAPDGEHTLVVLDRQDCSTVTSGRL